MITLATLSVGLALAGGLWPFGGDEPASTGTIGDLKRRDVAVEVTAAPVRDVATAMEEYRRFLALNTGPEQMRLEAMRRLADLSLEAGLIAEAGGDDGGGGLPQFAEAVRLYQELLAASGAQGDRARILYQLARALEGAGRGDDALRTLDQLVTNHRESNYAAEAQFRRGETYFVRKDYRNAELAYAQVMAAGPDSGFYEQSLYKHGWSLFKQGRHEESLDSFLQVLNRRLDPGGGNPSAYLERLSRPERELVDDSLRVTSLGFSYLEGAASIDAELRRRGDRPWSYLLYRALGDQYLEKDRFRDAAEAYQAFVAHDPVNAQAPLLQQAAIEAYTRGKFPSLVLESKRRFVETYGLDAPFWQGRNAEEFGQVVAQLKAHLSDLADYDHALAQKSKDPVDYARAAGWYRRFLAYFPTDPQSAQRSFLLGELLFESRNFAEARDAYLVSAYKYGSHDKAAEAGYAALLASREHEKSLQGAARNTWHAEYVEHALKFAATFPEHAQAGAVLTNVAEELFAAGQLERAVQVAGLVITLQPPASTDLERVAWTVMAHSQFDLKRFADAERSYTRLMAYDLDAKQRKDVEARVAAAIYRQGEAAQAGGDVSGAVGHYLRIASSAPGAEIRPNALFDAATLLLNAKRWSESTALLQQFRREYPDHRFNSDVTVKLATTLREEGRGVEAAAEFERLAGDASQSADARRQAIWQAADLYRAGGNVAGEQRSYETIVTRFPERFDESIEARHRLAEIAAVAGDWPARQRRLEDLIAADGSGGANRTVRSRFLAAQSAIELARPARDAFFELKLSIPLDKSLKEKKRRMELALQAYARAADYGAAGVTTAATFETAELYFQLSRDLLGSERPRDLSAEEREQYDVLLEEQAFPFEEKALELYRVNADRATDGVYDEWVRASFARLASISPARYARTERSEDVIDWID